MCEIFNNKYFLFFLFNSNFSCFTLDIKFEQKSSSFSSTTLIHYEAENKDTSSKWLH